MCGLAGFIVKDRNVMTGERIERLADRLLAEVDSRGGHATGLLALTAGAPYLMKAACKAREFASGRPLMPADSWAVIGHTRFATQGHPAFPFNNHPLRVGDTFVAHNGHIRNDHSLIVNSGRNVYQHVDSAAIAAVLEVSRFESDAAMITALERLEGGAAIAAASPLHLPGRVLLARGCDSPLVIYRARAATVWASTAAAIRNAWSDVVGAAPDWNTLEQVREGTIYLVGTDTERMLRFHPDDGWSRWVKSSPTTQQYKTGGKKTPAAPTQQARAAATAQKKTPAAPTQQARAAATAQKTTPTKKTPAAPKKKKGAGIVSRRKAKRSTARSAPTPSTPAQLRRVEEWAGDDEPLDRCDGCRMLEPWHTLQDMGVGYFCDTCVEVAEATGYLPGWSERYAGSGT